MLKSGQDQICCVEGRLPCPGSAAGQAGLRPDLQAGSLRGQGGAAAAP